MDKLKEALRIRALDHPVSPHLHEDGGVLEGAHDAGVVEAPRRGGLHAAPGFRVFAAPLAQGSNTHLEARQGSLTGVGIVCGDRGATVRWRQVVESHTSCTSWCAGFAVASEEGATVL